MSVRYIYIVIFSIAIVGLSIVQYQYFRIGVNLAGVQFDEKIAESLEAIKQGLLQKDELTFLVGSAMTKQSGNFNLGLDSIQDASTYFLEDFIRGKLIQNGAKLDFAYKLYATDSTLYLQSSGYSLDTNGLLNFPVEIEGYLPSLVNKDLFIELQFQNVNRYLLSQLNGLTIPSIIFLTLIIIVILWVFRAFYLQNNLITTTNEFINNLTHELKTPVFSIGVATKILEEKGTEAQRPLVEMIRSQVVKLKGQIDKVLELGVIEEKKGVIKKKEVELKPMLMELAKVYEQQADFLGITFNAVFKGDEYWVSADQYHIENAINGLLENAYKYSDKVKNIRMLVFKSDDHLYIEIEDKGIGIKEQDVKKVFDKYYRVSDGDKHNVKGYGLGLHYVKRIVHLHKGRIRLTSKVGEGSTFSLRLPLLKR